MTVTTPSSRRLRVLILTTSYPLRVDSSCGVFVRRLAQALSIHHQVSVLCPADISETPPHSFPEVPVFPFRYGPRSWQTIGQAPGGILPALKSAPWRAALLPAYLAGMAYSLIKRSRSVDVIHANWAVCGAIAGALRIVHRRPIVLTLRGDDVTRAAKSMLHRRVLKTAIAQADSVACVSASMRSTLLAKFPEHLEKFELALNGVGDEYAAATKINEEDSPNSVVSFLFVGSLIKRKGVGNLLQAFAHIERPSSRLIVAGNGPLRNELQQLASELCIDDKVSFLGEVAPTEIPALLHQSQVLVLPSYSEGRPNVMLEAMAAQIPVVSTKIPGVVETLQDGKSAWLVAPGDVDALSAALVEAFDSPHERATRADAAHCVFARGNFSWAACADTYNRIFQRLS